MYKLPQKLMAIILSTITIMSMVACGEQAKPEETKDIAEIVEQPLTTAEFGKDNFQRYWYCNQDIESKYEVLLKEFKPVEGKTNEQGTHQIYVDKDNVEYIINGVTPVPVESLTEDSLLFLERTGEFVRDFYTPEEKAYFIGVTKVLPEYFNGTRDLMAPKETRNSIINGVTFETPNVISVPIGADVPEEAIDFEMINKYVDAEWELNIDDPDDAVFELMTSPMKATGETIIIPVGVNKFKKVTDDYGQYWSAKYDTKTEKLYIPVSVIKNIIGWDIVYCKENKVLAIVTDSVYGVAENQENLICLYTDDNEQTEVNTQPVIIVEPEQHKEEPVIKDTPKEQPIRPEPKQMHNQKIDTKGWYEGMTVSRETAKYMVLNPRKDWGVEPDGNGNWVLVDLVENARQVKEAIEYMEKETEKHEEEMKGYVQKTDPDSIVFG